MSIDYEPKFANLHLHSTHSDGVYSPAELVRLAKKEGYKALAVTDHDVITGIPEMPMSDKIFVIQSDVIKKIAAEGPCVIVGRCAESILKDEVNCLSIFIHADFDSRIQRVSEYDKISHDQAAEQIRKTDKKRASYHNYYSELKWGAATSYDFCINSKIGIENAAKLIVDIYNMR